MSAVVSADQLAADLRRLGVPHGGVVMLHASMRALGPVVGGAEVVLATLLETVGQEGTLLMVRSAPDDPPFDAATTPVDTEDMGILAAPIAGAAWTRASR